MRLSSEKGRVLKMLVRQKIPRAAVYLFGSRVYDHRRGGDIDILIIGDRKLTLREKIHIKTAFQMRFGAQKVDLVSFTRQTQTPFQKLILQDAISL